MSSAGILPGAPSGATVHYTAAEVLYMHADLQEQLTRPSTRMADDLAMWAAEALEKYPQWAASHLHPAQHTGDLKPWFASLGTDLFGATTYQVTAEMTDLALKLQETAPSLEFLPEEEIPCPWGFMWLDKPVPRPAVDDDGREPEMMHAFSWAKVPAMKLKSSHTGTIHSVPGVRIREWAYYPARNPPLVLMGQNMTPIGLIDGQLAGSPLPEVRTIHMLWILLGMEIVSTDPDPLPRWARRSAAKLRHQQVNVVQLRRVRHAPSASHHPSSMNWSCAWLVRGHNRKAPNGGTFKDGRTCTWVKPFIKDPAGKPLKASDILYRLGR